MANQSLVIVSGSKSAPGAPMLLKVAQDQGIDATLTYIDDPLTVSRINAADTVLYRMSPQMRPKYIALLDVLVEEKRSQLADYLAAFSKINMYDARVSTDIPTPKSYTISRDQQVLEYPIVIKIPNGYQGLGVELIRNENDLATFKAEFSDEDEFLVQECIEESKGSDKRLFIVGDTCVAAMKRTSQTDDFRANLHLGGAMASYEPTAQEVAYALAATKVFNLDFAGIDIIDSNRGPLVLEINPSPGFGIQAVSTHNIAEEVVRQVVKA